MSAPETDAPSSPAAARRELLWILALAALLRLVRLIWFTPIIEADGAEYCRIAENLLSGRGLVGLVPGPEIMLPPLHGILIAALSRLSSLDVELCARLISFVAGLVVVGTLWRLALHLHGPRTARITGGLAALLPAFVLSSTAAFAEGLQLGLLLPGIYWLVRTAETRRVAPALASGLLIGISYLVRVEGFALGMLGALLLAVGYPRAKAPGRRGFVPALAFLATLAIAMSPYVIYLESVTGQIRLEGKSERVVKSLERYHQGLDYARTNYWLTEEGLAVGPWLEPGRILEDQPGLLATLAENPGGAARYTLRNLKQLAWMIVSGHTLSSLLFVALALLALLSKSKSRGTRFLDLFLLGLLFYVSTLGALYKIHLRYFLPLALLSALWGARGLVILLARREASWSPTKRRLVEAAAILLLTLSTWRGAVTGFKEYDETDEAQRGVQTLGHSLRDRDEPRGAIMGDDSRVAWYAGRDWLPLPAAASFAPIRARARDLGARYLNLRLPGSEGPCKRPGPWFNPDALPEGLELLESANGVALYRIR